MKKISIQFYKLLVIVSAASILYLLFLLTQMSLVSIASVTVFGILLTQYQAVKCLVWATALHILIIKVGVKMKGGAKHDRMFFVHLVFAILYTMSILSLFIFYNYLSLFHAVITYFAAFSFLIVTVIGLPMLLKRF